MWIHLKTCLFFTFLWLSSTLNGCFSSPENVPFGKCSTRDAIFKPGSLTLESKYRDLWKYCFSEWFIWTAVSSAQRNNDAGFGGKLHGNEWEWLKQFKDTDKLYYQLKEICLGPNKVFCYLALYFGSINETLGLDFFGSVDGSVFASTSPTECDVFKDV